MGGLQWSKQRQTSLSRDNRRGSCCWKLHRCSSCCSISGRLCSSSSSSSSSSSCGRLCSCCSCCCCPSCCLCSSYCSCCCLCSSCSSCCQLRPSPCSWLQ